MLLLRILSCSSPIPSHAMAAPLVHEPQLAAKQAGEWSGIERLAAPTCELLWRSLLGSTCEYEQ
jgi:hypothetical protein